MGFTFTRSSWRASGKRRGYDGGHAPLAIPPRPRAKTYSIMAPKLNTEYSKTPSTPAPLVPSSSPRSRKFFFLGSPANGPGEYAVQSLQNQIDFHVGEAHWLRYAQNSHATVSRLPPEFSSEVFLHIIESGLQGGNTCSVTGTFGFLLVCRH